MLHLSSRFTRRTLRLFAGRSKIACISSGIGSWRSRAIFAPRAFGIAALKTSASGMLWTCTKSYLRTRERIVRKKNDRNIKAEYWLTYLSLPRNRVPILASVSGADMFEELFVKLYRKFARHSCRPVGERRVIRMDINEDHPTVLGDPREFLEPDFGRLFAKQ